MKVRYAILSTLVALMTVPAMGAIQCQLDLFKKGSMQMSEDPVNLTVIQQKKIGQFVISTTLGASKDGYTGTLETAANTTGDNPSPDHEYQYLMKITLNGKLVSSLDTPSLPPSGEFTLSGPNVALDCWQ